MKIVVNTGRGFDLSPRAYRLLARLLGIPIQPMPEVVPWTADVLWYFPDDPESYYYQPLFVEAFRANPALVQVVETLGAAANTAQSSLKVVTIPDGVDWYLHEREDGSEVVYEQHRRWE